MNSPYRESAPVSKNKPYIGGQAVIEGVMMRAPGCLSIAVRRPDGGIAVKEGPSCSGSEC